MNARGIAGEDPVGRPPVLELHDVGRLVGKGQAQEVGQRHGHAWQVGGVEPDHPGQQLRVPACEGPHQQPAPVVADDHRLGGPELTDQLGDALVHPGFVVADVGLVAAPVAGQVDRHRPVAGPGQGRQLVTPGPRRLGKAVDQHHQWPAPGGHGEDPDAVHGEVLLPHSPAIYPALPAASASVAADASDAGYPSMACALRDRLRCVDGVRLSSFGRESVGAHVKVSAVAEELGLEPAALLRMCRDRGIRASWEESELSDESVAILREAIRPDDPEHPTESAPAVGATRPSWPASTRPSARR